MGREISKDKNNCPSGTTGGGKIYMETERSLNDLLEYLGIEDKNTKEIVVWADDGHLWERMIGKRKEEKTFRDIDIFSDEIINEIKLKRKSIWCLKAFRKSIIPVDCIIRGYKSLFTIIHNKGDEDSYYVYRIKVKVPNNIETLWRNI